MKIVLQNKTTRLYWKQTSAWTPDVGEAHDFETTTHAQHLCRLHQWQDVHVVLKFDHLPDLILSA